MAGKQGFSQNKRNRERDKRDKKLAKLEKKALRKAEKVGAVSDVDSTAPSENADMIEMADSSLPSDSPSAESHP